MNFYPFHIGDYLSATRHLTWDEDAAYRRLLDAYYTSEKPLPADERQVFRLVVASTDAQRDAVKTVLQEFFTLTEAGWVNERADREIEVMRDKQQKQRDKANKRWHKPDTDSGNASAMPQHQNADAVAQKADADAMPPIPIPIPTPIPKSNTPLPPKGEVDPPGFAEFWDSWPQSPRKVDRKKCADKWRRKRFDAVAKEIAAHIVAMKGSRQWMDGFEPAPLTYLNGERWRDGVQAEAGSFTAEFV